MILSDSFDTVRFCFLCPSIFSAVAIRFFASYPPKPVSAGVIVTDLLFTGNFDINHPPHRPCPEDLKIKNVFWNSSGEVLYFFGSSVLCVLPPVKFFSLSHSWAWANVEIYRCLPKLLLGIQHLCICTFLVPCLSKRRYIVCWDPCWVFSDVETQQTFCKQAHYSPDNVH